MNSKIVFVLFLSMMGLTINLKAQTDAKQQQAEEKEKQELRQKFQKGMQARKMERAHQRSIEVQTNKYNHLEAEILAKLNTQSIPADFPIFQPEYTNEQYNFLMNKWYEANPSLLKKKSNTNEPK